MPTKFKPSAKQFDRQTKKTTTSHYYIKGTPKKELFEYLNNQNGKPKIKQKVRNELQRRGIGIVWKPITE